MDTRTGIIKGFSNDAELEKALRENPNLVQIDARNLPAKVAEQLRSGNIAKIGRNDPCPCGSGRKFKKCCKDKIRVIRQ